MLRITLIALFIFCSITSISYAQDSVKKVNTVKPAAAKYKAYKYPPVKYAAAKTAVPVVPTAAPVKQVPAPVVPQAPVDKSLNGQYQFLLTKVYHYQQAPIADLWRNINDTLRDSRHKLKDAVGKLAAQNKTIDSLNAAATTKDQNLAAANSRVNAVSLLGIPIQKSVYNLIMCGLVIIFGATAAIVLARSGSHSREAKYRINLYNELEEEFKTYKAKANEKEKKLARELQTERNKLDELMGRS
ncbi:hypothetical protein [Mucilaginibacter sp.]|uniref:hypothetical protein n=1 Tax=Mucilaginibacter sp. TaxID=1882438 RepID=UPI003D0D72F2